ncbi:uncharacterized protein [Littorina saxatilis]|uniref:Uncharacterized protein n=1 Tax=Littorina saxatilis TaxID=31220 RepID=A0AAN9FZK4_9CAEN
MDSGKSSDTISYTHSGDVSSKRTSKSVTHPATKNHGKAKRNQNPCPQCGKVRTKVTDHLVRQHGMPRAEARLWHTKAGVRPKKRRERLCPICQRVQTNMGQHLRLYHVLQKDSPVYRRHVSDKPKGVVPAEGDDTRTEEIAGWVPSNIDNRALWMDYCQYLQQDKRKSGAESRSSAQQLLQWFAQLDGRCCVPHLLRKPSTDSDFVGVLFFELIVTPLIKAVEKDAKKASAALNKFNNLKTFLDFIKLRKSMWLVHGGGSLEALDNLLTEVGLWTAKHFRRAKRIREGQLKTRWEDSPKEYEAVQNKVNRLRQQVLQVPQTPERLRDRLLAYLAGSNLSRSGEVANLTAKEVHAARPRLDKPDWLEMKVKNHKTCVQHGPAVLLCPENVHQVLQGFVRRHGHQQAFANASGGRLNPSKVAQICQQHLGMNPSRWRRMFSHENRNMDTKFTKTLSTKMMHSEQTHRRWYEGAEGRQGFLDVVLRVHGLPASSADVPCQETVDAAPSPTTRTRTTPAPCATITRPASGDESCADDSRQLESAPVLAIGLPPPASSLVCQEPLDAAPPPTTPTTPAPCATITPPASGDESCADDSRQLESAPVLAIGLPPPASSLVCQEPLDAAPPPMTPTTQAPCATITRPARGDESCADDSRQLESAPVLAIGLPPPASSLVCQEPLDAAPPPTTPTTPAPCATITPPASGDTESCPDGSSQLESAPVLAFALDPASLMTHETALPSPPPLTHSDLPQELQDGGFQLPKEPMHKDEVPPRSTWSLTEHAWLHHFFGAYRGETSLRMDRIRQVLTLFPEAAAKLQLKHRNAQKIRDKLRCWSKGTYYD